MTTEVEIGGVIRLPVGSAFREIVWIEYLDRAWLVPLWIVSSDQQTRKPLRIISPRFAPGYTPLKGPDALRIFEGMLLPASLLERGEIPDELRPVVEVRENPDIWSHIPDG